MEGASFSASGLLEEAPLRAMSATDFFIGNDDIAQAALDLEEVELSVELETWVDRYERVGDRHPYLWTWCQHGVQLTTLPCTPPERRGELRDTKVLGVMMDVLIDDVADRGGDQRLLERLLGLAETEGRKVGGPLDCDCQEYAELTEAVWNEVERRVRHFPRYQELAELLRYDYRQLMNAMRYSHMLNQFPALLNLAEHDLYLPHNMHMMISATMDLMCSPDFDLREIGRLREAICHAQYMGRVGNLITTWQREIAEGDFTSGVFARAVIYGDTSLDELRNGDHLDIVRAIQEGGHEAYFLRKWQGHRQGILRLQPSIRSVDLLSWTRGLERLLCLHLASRGLK